MVEEDSRGHSREVARGSFWGILGTVVLKLVSFAYVIYVARAFSQENVGLFYLALSVIGVLGFWRDLGLPAALQRYVPFYEAKGQNGKALSLLKSSLAIELLLGIALSAAIFFLADPIGVLDENPRLGDGLHMLSAYVIFENLSKVVISYLQGRRDIKSLQFINNIQNITKLVFTVLFFDTFGATLFSLSIAFVLSFVVAFLAGVPLLAQKTADLTGNEDKLANAELLHEILPFGITLTIVQSFWMLVSSTDKMLLGYFGDPSISIELVAIYSMATQVALSIMVFPGAVGGIFLPVISRLAGKEDYAAMRKVTETAQRWMLFITLPIALAVAAFSGEMLSTFYGGTYRSGAVAMSIFILGLVFSTATYPISLALAGMRLIHLELKIAIAAGITNVALNVLLIPRFGMEGAALASALAFLLSAWIFERYGKQYLGYRTPDTIYKLFVAAVVAFLIVLFCKPFAASISTLLPVLGNGELAIYAAKFSYLAVLVVAGCFGLVFFGSAALVLRTFKHEDIDLMHSAAKKARVPMVLIELVEKIALMGVDDVKKNR